MLIEDLHLGPTCWEVLNYLEDNSDDCSTVNDLTKTGKRHSNWETVKKCLEKLEEEGYVYPDKKCVQKANCFRIRRNRQYADSEEPCTVDNVEAFTDSNTGRTNLYVPKPDECLDPFYQKVEESIPKGAKLLSPSARLFG
jgi:hypothetical protein